MFPMTHAPLFRVLALLTAVLLSGCPNPNRLDIVRSTNQATQNIGLDFQIIQREINDEISIKVNPFKTDGIEKTAIVNLWTGDDIVATVVDQDVEITTDDGGTEVEFTLQKSSLQLPAIIKVEFIRTSNHVSALETYLTINAFFETTFPTDGTVYNKNGEAEFAWALRDSDGNSVPIEGNYTSVATVINDPSVLYPPFVSANFTSVEPGIDGNSKIGRLPALELIPEDAFGEGITSWELNIRLRDAMHLGPRFFELWRWHSRKTYRLPFNNASGAFTEIAGAQRMQPNSCS